MRRLLVRIFVEIHRHLKTLYRKMQLKMWRVIFACGEKGLKVECFRLTDHYGYFE